MALRQRHRPGDCGNLLTKRSPDTALPSRPRPRTLHPAAGPLSCDLRGPEPLKSGRWRADNSRMRRLRAGGRRRVPGQGNAGFTVVEVIVAITIAGFVFLSMGLATIAAMKGTLTARQNQLAVDLGTHALEQVRSLGYGDVTLVSGDSTLGSDPRVQSGNRFDPGTGTAEDLVLSSVGTLNPHVEVVSKNSIDYSIWTYITEPAGAHDRRSTGHGGGHLGARRPDSAEAGVHRHHPDPPRPPAAAFPVHDRVGACADPGSLD